MMSSKLATILAMLLVFPTLVMANPIDKKWAHEKSKTITKGFSVNSDALLRISNKYGNVDMVSWDQNRVEIEVTITVSGNNESKVNSRLEQIDVKFSNSASEVSAKTVIESSSGWFNSGNKMNYQINYKVKVPVTNSTKVTNDYGSISLNEIRGHAEINCDYGKILIGSLYHEDNEINIDYTSNSVIEFMNTGRINADYSQLTVEKSKSIRLNADYTDTKIDNIEDLNFSCDYGKIEIGNANSVEGQGDYLTMRFGNVYKKLVVEADYGGIKINKLMKGFELVSVRSDYTGVKIGLEDGSAFNFKAKLGYGGFDLDAENVNYVKKEVKSSSKYYEGFVNRENSGSTIDIVSDYGGVNLYMK
jgi:hypothetical protein